MAPHFSLPPPIRCTPNQYSGQFAPLSHPYYVPPPGIGVPPTRNVSNCLPPPFSQSFAGYPSVQTPHYRLPGPISNPITESRSNPTLNFNNPPPPIRQPTPSQIPFNPKTRNVQGSDDRTIARPSQPRYDRVGTSDTHRIENEQKVNRANYMSNTPNYSPSTSEHSRRAKDNGRNGARRG